MKPKLELLDAALVSRVLDEAFQLLQQPGIKVQAENVVEMLHAAGARVENGVAHIPASLAQRALDSAPHEFCLYDRAGNPAVRYGGDVVQFDPGSSCLNILDPESLRPRLAQADDLVRLVQLAEMLPQFEAQSTAVVCGDVPSEIGDLYRLFLVLWYSAKPVVTGAFSAAGVRPMIELLAAEAGSTSAMKARPRAVFDVCPSPPLNWSEFGAQNLVELGRAGVPAQIVSMPLAGVAAPVTLIGAVVQHAAECISGITIHQLAAPGAPIVWGAAPAIMDMRTGTTPMGAIETVMIDMACAQVGKRLDLPTHAYLAASDSKLVDAQAGMESAVSAVLGALAGINMISGAGMLDFLACHSAEKLAIDAEAIASAQRLLAGIAPRAETLATAIFAAAAVSGGDFLTLPETRALLRVEQHFPSGIIDRSSAARDPLETPADAFCRARQRISDLLKKYQRPALANEVERNLRAVVEQYGRPVSLNGLPGI